MKSLTVILGALTAFALGACTVTGTTSGSGGSTGTGGQAAGVGGSGGAGSTTSTTATSTGATGTGGAAACETYTCSEAITPPDGDPNKLCQTGPHTDLYDALAACTCTGACKAKCEANACMAGGSATAECTACLQDPVAGCQKEFAACAGDAPT